MSERLTDKLTDSVAGMADEVLEKWKVLRIKQNNRRKKQRGWSESQEHEYKARDKTIQKMSRDGLEKKISGIEEEKRITGRDKDTRDFHSEKKDELDFSKKGVTGSMKRGKQNIQSKVPEKPDMVGKLSGTKIRNQI